MRIPALVMLTIATVLTAASARAQTVRPRDRLLLGQRSQERALASLICTSPESIEAFIKFCMTESAALLRPREHIVRAMTAELLVRRTMNGDQVDTIIMQAVAAKALADEHARRAAWRRTVENAASFVADEQA